MGKEGQLKKTEGLKIVMLREALGLTVEEFAQKTKITASFLKLLEKSCVPLSKRDNIKIRDTFALKEDWYETMNINDYVPKKLSKLEGQQEDLIDVIRPTQRDINDTEKNNKNSEHTSTINITDGETLKNVRTNAGLSRKEIADAIGITPVLIGYIETGKRKLTDNVKTKINDYFNSETVKTYQKTTEDNAVLEVPEATIANKTKESAEKLTDEELLKRVQYIEVNKGYTQGAICDKTGLNRSQFSMIERGKVSISKRAREKLNEFVINETKETIHVAEKNTGENPDETKEPEIIEIVEIPESIEGTEDIEASETSEIDRIQKSTETSIVNNSDFTNKDNEYEVQKEQENQEKESYKSDEEKAGSFINKEEFQSILESMKKTRDELDANISVLESIFNNLNTSI